MGVGARSGPPWVALVSQYLQGSAHPLQGENLKKKFKFQNLGPLGPRPLHPESQDPETGSPGFIKPSLTAGFSEVQVSRSRPNGPLPRMRCQGLGWVCENQIAGSELVGEIMHISVKPQPSANVEWWFVIGQCLGNCA